MAFLGIFAGSFIVALSGALMPGPLLSVTISESARRGAMTGPLLIAGHALLELAMLAALLLGLGPLLTHDISALLLGLAGGALLCWMAIGIFRTIRSFRIEPTVAQPFPGRHLSVIGILMSLANPYWTLWWATIGLGYLTFARNAGVGGIAAFFCGHILGDLVWYSLVSWSFSHARQFLSDTVYRGIMLVCGIALAGFAVWFFWSGVNAYVRIAG